jgi:membrane protease subunit HflK
MSFNILKLIMIVLVLVFIASSFFTVSQEEQALVLRLGKICGIGEERVRQPGWGFAVVPMYEVVKIPVKKVQTLAINSFWYYQTDEEKLSGKGFPGKTLNPLQDGYSLTRNDSTGGVAGNDYNIVHSRWQLTYTISDPERFFKNVWVKPTIRGQTYADVMNSSISGLLTNITSDAVVSTMVHYSIDEAIQSNARIASAVQHALQAKLDAIESGIKINGVALIQTTWPRQVDDAFVSSIKASQESEKLVSQAKGYAENILNEAGGPVVYEILDQLKKPSLSQDQQEALWSRLAGSAQEEIAGARAYRTSVVESAKASADYLASIYPEFIKRPGLVIQKIYQDTVESVLAAADEKIVVQAGSGKDRQVRIQVNKDPQAKPRQKSEK